MWKMPLDSLRHVESYLSVSVEMSQDSYGLCHKISLKVVEAHFHELLVIHILMTLDSPTDKIPQD